MFKSQSDEIHTLQMQTNLRNATANVAKSDHPISRSFSVVIESYEIQATFVNCLNLIGREIVLLLKLIISDFDC